LLDNRALQTDLVRWSGCFDRELRWKSRSWRFANRSTSCGAATY